MVTVLKGKAASSRNSRRHRSSANDGVDRQYASGGSNDQPEHEIAIEALPRSNAARSLSGAHPPSHLAAKDYRTVLANQSGAIDETMDTEQLSSLSSSSSRKSVHRNDMPSPGLSPIHRRKESDDVANPLPTSAPTNAPVPKGLVAIPVVTRSTRRETFASAKAPMKKERKKKPIGESSPQSSTSSNGVDDNIMDLFAPPQSARSRSRQSSVLASNPPAKKLSPSTSEVASTRPKRMKAAQVSTSPPRNSKAKSLGTLQTPLKTSSEAIERKAMSTTTKKQYSRPMSHLHHPGHSDDFDPFATFHKSPAWEIDASQKTTESAPARMPVSVLNECIFS